jgi:hypothetical protein
VLDGLEAVRRSGFTNMLARTTVADLAEEFGFQEAARWIKAQRDLYARGLFRGFEAEEER